MVDDNINNKQLSTQYTICFNYDRNIIIYVLPNHNTTMNVLHHEFHVLLSNRTYYTSWVRDDFK